MVKAAKKVESRKQEDSKLFAFLAVLLSIIGFLVAILAKREDKYVMHYAKQSLILFFGWLIVWIASMVLMLIPVLGNLVIALAYVCLLVLWIIGLVYSLSGEMKEIPLVGQFSDMINL